MCTLDVVKELIYQHNMYKCLCAKMDGKSSESVQCKTVEEFLLYMDRKTMVLCGNSTLYPLSDVRSFLNW